MSKLADEILVEMALDDIKYFAYIYERYENKLTRYILRISSFSLTEAEEVLQEAFIKVWKNLKGFDNSLKFSNWVYRIVHNTTISEWKKTLSKGKSDSREVDEELFNNLPSMLDLEMKEQVEQKLGEKNIRTVLDAMPSKYREVLVLKFLEEKNYNEISDILRKPGGTVATLINRAKKAFREIAETKNISFEM